MHFRLIPLFVTILMLYTESGVAESERMSVKEVTAESNDLLKLLNSHGYASYLAKLKNNKYHAPILVGNKRVMMFLDTGASSCFMEAALASKLRLPLKPANSQVQVMFDSDKVMNMTQTTIHFGGVMINNFPFFLYGEISGADGLVGLVHTDAKVLQKFQNESTGTGSYAHMKL